MSPNDPFRPRRRAPGGGRKPALGGHVVNVSISLDPDTLDRVNRAARRAGRTRSAFVRWAVDRVIREIDRSRRERERPYDFGDKDPTRGGIWEPALAGQGFYDCPGCDTNLPTAFVFCPQCGTENPRVTG